MPWLLQQRFLDRMRAELNLTSDQIARLERVLAESRERVRIINDLVRPEIQAEMRNTREQVKAELTPEQRRRFEELMRSRPGGRMNDPSFRPGQRPRDRPEGRFDSRPAPSNPAP
jgi:Spy/CpxP family protein refolding chaperone